MGICLLLAGCSATVEVPVPTESEIRLHQIGRAYVRACDALNRPPRSADELRSFLDSAEDDAILRSPRDGKEYVILWGVRREDLTRPVMEAATGQRRYPVLAHEKDGKDGTRMVLQMPPQVVEMSAEELRRAYFPPPHKPPQ